MSSAVRPLPVSRLLPCRGSRSGRASCLRRPFLSVVFWPTLYSSYRVSFFVSHLHTFLYRTYIDLNNVFLQNIFLVYTFYQSTCIILCYLLANSSKLHICISLFALMPNNSINATNFSRSNAAAIKVLL